VVFLSNIAPIVVFSAAQPGQGGLGHVNEQPTDYWIDLFEKEGQIYRPDLTAQLRARLDPLTMSAPWLPANLTVFSRDAGRRVPQSDIAESLVFARFLSSSRSGGRLTYPGEDPIR
jgi:hypothetical protein